MGTRLSLYCNGAIRKEPHRKFISNFDRIHFANAVKRDKYGIRVKDLDKEEENGEK